MKKVLCLAVLSLGGISANALAGDYQPFISCDDGAFIVLFQRGDLLSNEGTGTAQVEIRDLDQREQWVNARYRGNLSDGMEVDGPEFTFQVGSSTEGSIRTGVLQSSTPSGQSAFRWSCQVTPLYPVPTAFSAGN